MGEAAGEKVADADLLSRASPKKRVLILSFCEFGGLAGLKRHERRPFEVAGDEVES